jgi:hypothetical protein
MTNIKSKPGPRSIPGKQISSKNAITHGATSSQLLCDADVKMAQKFIRTMASEYGKNSTLLLQYERAARVHVQINRVQNMIDNQFALAKELVSEDINLKKKLNMDEYQWLQAKMSATPLLQKIFQKELQKSIPKADEFSKIAQVIPDINGENFVTVAPKLANYLYNQSEVRGVTLTYFLHDLSGRFMNEEALFNEIGRTITAVNNSELLSDPEKVKEAFLELQSTNLLQRFVNWYGNYYRYAQDTQYKVECYLALVEQYRACAMPDPEVLDRLMRYQTTLQRQYSTILGEIHVLANSKKQALSMK